MLNRALTVATVLALGAALTASAGTYPMSLDQAFDKAAQTEKPVLMKIGTEWCSSCKAFDKAVASNDEFRAGVGEDAILVQIDAEKGDGVQIAQRYQVSNFPTFILANAEGEVMDRWLEAKDEDRSDYMAYLFMNGARSLGNSRAAKPLLAYALDASRPRWVRKQALLSFPFLRDLDLGCKLLEFADREPDPELERLALDLFWNFF